MKFDRTRLHTRPQFFDPRFLFKPRRMIFDAHEGHFIAQLVALQGYEITKLLIYWSEWQDLNLRPLRPEPSYRAA